MQKIHPDMHDLRIYQKLGRVDAKSLDSVDQLLLILPAKPSKADFGKLPQGATMQAVYRKHGRLVRPLSRRDWPISDRRWSSPGRSPQTPALSSNSRSGASWSRQQPGKKPAAWASVRRFRRREQGEHRQQRARGRAGGGLQSPAFKSKATPATIKSIRLLGVDKTIDTSAIEAEAKGNNLARWLTTLPPNMLDASNYADLAKTMAKDNGWAFKRFGTRNSSKLGAVRFWPSPRATTTTAQESCASATARLRRTRPPT